MPKISYKKRVKLTKERRKRKARKIEVSKVDPKINQTVVDLVFQHYGNTMRKLART